MALKDKLMTLEDFKAVRDVDVASNSAQFTDIKADLDTLAGVTPIPDNSDLNNYTETGLYTIENGNYTILHYPMDTVVASYLEVTALTTGYIAQKMTFAGLGTVYVRRRYSNGTWNEWIQIAKDVRNEKGLTDPIIVALLNAFDNVAWSNTSGRQYYNALYNAINGIEYPKITATLSLGTNKVYSIDSVDILRTYLTVTYYEDVSSVGSVITNYAISGNLSDGTNKVIVRYAGLSVYVTVPVTDFYNVFRWTAQDNRYSVVNGAVENVNVDSTVSRVVVVNESQTTRKAFGLSFGTLKLVASGTLQPVNVYPIPIPDTATKVKVTYTSKEGKTIKYIVDTITKHTQSDDYYYMNGYGSWLSSGETANLGASGKSNRWGIVVFDGNRDHEQNFSNVQIDFLTEA